MHISIALQYLVIALAVLVSAAVVMKKQFPSTVRRMRGSIALAMVKPSRPQWMQSLGRRLAPPAAGAGGGCCGCDSCGPAPQHRH